MQVASGKEVISVCQVCDYIAQNNNFNIRIDREEGGGSVEGVGG